MGIHSPPWIFPPAEHTCLIAAAEWSPECLDSCFDCSAQGYILTYLKSIFGEKLLVFSLDVNFNEPMVQILKENYEIEELPTVIVGDKVFSGLTKKEELINELCLSYSDASFDACE